MQSPVRKSPRTMLQKSLPIRYSVYLLAVACSSGAGAVYSSINFAWVCITNSTSNLYSKNQSVAAETNWGAKQQEVIFAAYSIGGFLSSMFSGQLLSRYGCRLVYTAAIAVASIATMLVPLGIHHSNEWAVVSFRIVTGIGASFFFPVAYSVSAIWAPATESGIVLALATSGIILGQFFALVIAGLECDNLGYQWIFYIDGIFGITVAAIWLAYYRDTPSAHPMITAKEAQLITETRATKAGEQAVKVPWLKFFTNIPILTCLVCRIFTSYQFWSMTLFIPTFFRDILLLKPQVNGYLSALTMLAAVFGRLTSGFVSDRAFRTPEFRIKLNDTICFTGTGICGLALALMHPGPDRVPASIVVFFLLLFCSCFFTGGHMKALLYNAPEYSAAVGSLLSGVGYVASTAVPFIVASITKNGKAEEWNRVFYGITGVGVLGTAVFLVFGSTKHQQLMPQQVAQENTQDTPTNEN